MSDNNRVLRRSQSDQKIAGVCGGLGEFFGIEQTGLPALHIADLLKDEEELRLSRHLADTLFQYRDSLTQTTRDRLRSRLKRAFGKTIRGVDAG